MTRGYTGGTFDLFHAGHVAFLQLCRMQCDHLTVALNTDEFCTRYKRKPILNLVERNEILLSCRYVDQVIYNTGSEDSRPSILRAGANIIFHGDDWTGPDYLKQLGISPEFLEAYKIRIRYINYKLRPEFKNTTQIIEEIKSR